MRYVNVVYSDGYCGSEEEFNWAFPDGTEDTEIDTICENYMYQYIDNHETDIGEYDDYESDTDYNDTYENFCAECSYNWIDVSEYPNIINDTKWEYINP